MAINLEGFVTWLKGWFYEKSEVYKKEETYSKQEVNNALSGKLNSNLVTANKMLVTGNNGDVELADKPVIPDVSGKIDTAGTGLSKSGTTLNHSNSVIAQTSSFVFKKIKYDGQGHITATDPVSDSDLPSHTHSAIDVEDDDYGSYTYISPNSPTQSEINLSIDSAIGNLQSIKAIEVVSTLPTASSSTMGKLYIISENSKVNVYYTQQTGSSYSWHKMDADILDELVVNWTDVQNRPTKTSDFTNDGADGTNVFVANNDSRLSDARTPTSHSHGVIQNDGTLRDNMGVISNSILYSNGNGVIIGLSALSTNKVEDRNAHINIGSGADATQSTINSSIDTAIGNLQSSTITSIALVDKNTDATGKIIFYTGDEPT